MATCDFCEKEKTVYKKIVEGETKPRKFCGQCIDELRDIFGEYQ